MHFDHWYLIIGVLLLAMALIGRRLERWPISTSMLYMAVGYALAWQGWLSIDSLKHQVWLERLSEIAVIVSLFSAGLKLRLPLNDRLWRLPLALAFGSMCITVGLVSLLGAYGLGLSWGAAVLLGAVLAPTDPVLASDVQVADTQDTDRVRFTLTAEAGLNDGTAFPFVMLGLGLLQLHELGDYAWRWWTIDVAWKILGGLGIGGLLGALLARFIVYLRSRHREATGMDDFLAMGLIAGSYGVAHVINTYGFLGVFAAGLALRVVERQLSRGEAPPDIKAAAKSEHEATHPEKAPAYMAEAVLHFNEHLERIGELTLVLIVGALLVGLEFAWEAVLVAAVLLLLIRPASTYPATIAARLCARQSALIAWFGVRGIGSVYYLFYGVTHGVPEADALRLVTITATVIAVSVTLHGVSVSPLMNWYERSVANGAEKEG